MKAWLRTAGAALAASVVAAAIAQLAPTFAWRRPLATPGDAPFYRVDLPADVYERVVRSDLGDIRILDARGTPVPFAFLAAPTAVREAVPPVALPFFPLRVDAARADLRDVTVRLKRDATGVVVDVATADGRALAPERLAGYLVDASEVKTPLRYLELALPEGTNVSTRVSVDASDDLERWRPAPHVQTLIALEYDGRRILRDRVVLEDAGKYLRLRFDGAAQVPPIAGVQGVFPERLQDAPRQWRKVDGVADKEAPGAYVFDLGGAFPADRLALDLPQINTVAPATISSRLKPDEPWRTVASTTFYRLREQGVELTSDTLAVGNAPARYWRVAFDTRAGGLGGVPALSAGYVPASIVFAARGGGPFELAYGSARAEAAALPIATLVPGPDERRAYGAFAAAVPGEAPSVPARAALAAPIDAKRWMLWGALVVATLVLGAMAYALVRQMKPAPAPPPPDGGSDGAPPTSQR